MPKKKEEKDFIEIGGSPVPGLTLRHVLRGHSDYITRIAWSPDGKYLASPSKDKTIRIWDGSTGECMKILEGHQNMIMATTWSPDGKNLASCSHDNTIRIWEPLHWRTVAVLKGHNNHINEVAWSNDKLASCDWNGQILIWDKEFHQTKKLEGHGGTVASLAWSPSMPKLASGGGNKLYSWNPETGEIDWRAESVTDTIYTIQWLPNQNVLISGGSSNEICFWDFKYTKPVRVLEGHTDKVISLSVSADGYLLASKSEDNTVRLWITANWTTALEFEEGCSSNVAGCIAFHPHLPILATLGEKDTIIRIWELDESVLLGQAKENVNYTTAKLVLVGDSGVGKTGLGWRLAHGEFKEHASTHGQQFWSIPQLGLKRKDGTDCEAVLWDLAGQHVYRQVHSIFLDNVSAALVLFDPTNRQDPLKGAQFWLEQLKGKGKLPPTVLVGARVDRGAPALSQAELDQFCQRYGITGGYISTSAMKGDGLDELMELLKNQIPWDEMTATVTTVTFKKIKDYVLSLKEKPDRKGVLVSPQELRKQLQATDKDWEFTDAEMMTAVGHLETHGYVSVLHNSAGEQFVLLTPDVLVNLAASIMLLADKNARELGAVSETELLSGNIPFDELRGLEKAEQQILIDAAILRFLEHSICFRETLNDDTLLIFPSLIKQKRPLQDDIPSTDDISYVVRGRVENIYASLVVLLGYTPSFTRINQWQNQAQYEMKEGDLCGFRSIEEREGEIELVLYYGEKMPQGGRDKFQELFEQFLYQRDSRNHSLPSCSL